MSHCLFPPQLSEGNTDISLRRQRLAEKKLGSSRTACLVPLATAMLIFEYQLKWVCEVSARICWNPAWQAGCAGMHVINKAQKTSKRMSLSYSVAHTRTHTPTPNSGCFLACGFFTTVASLLYLHFHLKRKQKHCQQSKLNQRALCNQCLCLSLLLVALTLTEHGRDFIFNGIS